MNRFPIQNFAFTLIVFTSVLVSKATLNSYEEGREESVSKVIISTSVNAAEVVPPRELASLNSRVGVLPSLLSPPSPTPESPAPIAAISPLVENAREEPTLKAAAALAGDLGSYQALLKINAFRRWPIASLTKLMTAVVVTEGIDLEGNTTLTVPQVAEEGEVGNFKAGEIFRIRDLLDAMLLTSSNDAASALASQFTEGTLVARLERKAKELGMADTAFFDSSGLSYLNQSTPWDLYKLANYIYSRHPEIFEVTRKATLSLEELGTHRKRELLNINRLAGRSDFLGGKTGYTEQARGNLISLFEKGGKAFVVIVLGSEDRFGETIRMYDYLTGS